MPGLFARVRLEQARASDGLLLPQQAVTRTQTGNTVMVVAPDGTVSVRAVQIAQAVSGQWVVLERAERGEQVMVDGFQKLRGNAPVKPVPWKAPPAATPPAPGVKP
jgi:membrane fusion protein (multidrug efflux system)